MALTRLGFKAVLFYGMLLAAFFAAPYLNLFFLLLAFASVLAVLGTWWGYRNVTGIRGALVEPAPVPAGSAHPARLRLRADKRNRFHLTATMAIDGEAAELSSHFDLPAGGDVLVPIELPPLSRGVHPIRLVRIESIFPFGALRWRRAIAAPCDLVVFPAPANLAVYRDRNGASGQGALGNEEATELGPSGLREYREGDELRNVHWKATARRCDLVIRELEGDASPGIEICLDLRAAPDAFEEALSLASALALECQTNKELFTLHSQDHTRTYGEGHASFDDLFDYLARAQPLATDADAPPAVSPNVLRLPLAVARPLEVTTG